MALNIIDNRSGNYVYTPPVVTVQNVQILDDTWQELPYDSMIFDSAKGFRVQFKLKSDSSNLQSWSYGYAVYVVKSDGSGQAVDANNTPSISLSKPIGGSWSAGSVTGWNSSDVLYLPSEGDYNVVIIVYIKWPAKVNGQDGYLYLYDNGDDLSNSGQLPNLTTTTQETPVTDIVDLSQYWLEVYGGKLDILGNTHKTGSKVALASDITKGTPGCFLHLVIKNILFAKLNIAINWNLVAPSGKILDTLPYETHSVDVGKSIEIHSYYFSTGTFQYAFDGFTLDENGQYVWKIGLSIQNTSGEEVLSQEYENTDLIIGGVDSHGCTAGYHWDATKLACVKDTASGSAFWSKYKWYIIGGVGIAIAGVGALVAVNKITKPLR